MSEHQLRSIKWKTAAVLFWALGAAAIIVGGLPG